LGNASAAPPWSAVAHMSSAQAQIDAGIDLELVSANNPFHSASASGQGSGTNTGPISSIAIDHGAAGSGTGSSTATGNNKIGNLLVQDGVAILAGTACVRGKALKKAPPVQPSPLTPTTPSPILLPGLGAGSATTT